MQLPPIVFLLLQLLIIYVTSEIQHLDLADPKILEDSESQME